MRFVIFIIIALPFNASVLFGQFVFSEYNHKSWYICLKTEQKFFFEKDTISEVLHVFYLPKEKKFYRIKFTEPDSTSFVFYEKGNYLEFVKNNYTDCQVKDPFEDSIYFSNSYFFYPPLAYFSRFERRMGNNVNEHDSTFFYEKYDSLHFTSIQTEPYFLEGISIQNQMEHLWFSKSNPICCKYEFLADIPGGSQYDRYTILSGDSNLVTIHSKLAETILWVDSIKTMSKEVTKESISQTNLKSPQVGDLLNLFQRRDTLPQLDDQKPFVLNKKYTLVDLWYTACIPCRKNFPGLDSLYAEFKNKIEFIGMNTKDSGGRKDKALETLKIFNTPYVNVFFSDKVARQAGINMYPTILVLDQSGRVLKVLEGHYPGWVNDMRVFLNDLP